MFERPREFGKRPSFEKPKAAEGNGDFEAERPLYERLRDSNTKMDQLLTALDAIQAFQSAGHGVQEDEKEKLNLQKEIRSLFKSLKQ